MLTVNESTPYADPQPWPHCRNDEANRVLETCDQLLRERAQIAAALADLPASWPNVRKVLNELQAIVG